MFEITEREYTKVKKWIDSHVINCPLGNSIDIGAIGGRFTYCFTPVSLGILGKIKCGCGEEFYFTDSSIDYFDYRYVMSVHKSQGSKWEK